MIVVYQLFLLGIEWPISLKPVLSSASVSFMMLGLTTENKLPTGRGVRRHCFRMFLCSDSSFSTASTVFSQSKVLFLQFIIQFIRKGDKTTRRLFLEI